MSLVRSTAGLHPSQRFIAWRQVIADTYMAVDMSRPRLDQPFDGEVEIVSLGAIDLSRMTVNGSRVARRHMAHIARGGEDRFFVTLPLHCRVAYSHCGRTAELDGESLYLVDPGQPVEVAYPQFHRVLNLSIPGPLLRRRLGTPEDYCGRRCPTDTGAGFLAKGMIVSLFEHADEIAPAQLAEFGERMVDMVALALIASFGVRGGTAVQSATSVRWAHLARAQRLIDSRLSDSRLGPSTIAAALGMSERYLAKIFELSGETVGGWIRERRLEWARGALVSPSFARHSIGAIAFAAGFTDITHFSHAFRRRYGISPRRHRAEAGRI